MSVRKRRWLTSKGEPKEAWVVDYVDGQGERRLKTFQKKRDADAFSATVTVEVRQGTHIADSESVTAKEAAEIWYTAVKNGRDGRDPAEASTLRQYRTHIDLHIVPRIGKVKLSKLNARTVGSFRDELLQDLSRPMARKVLTSLKGIVGEAQSRDLVAVNAAASIKISMNSRHKEPVEMPTRAEISAVLAKLDELASQSVQRNAKAWRRWRALIATAIYTGCRASELRGLPWSSVDLDAGTLAIVQRADEKGVIGPVKSGAGYRTISMPAALVTILRKWKLECPGGALVFANWQGNVENISNIHKRCWQPLQHKAGLIKPVIDELGNVVRDGNGAAKCATKYPFHALRHFHASMLINDGEANPKEVQSEMGHSSIQITFDLYGHLFEDDHAVMRRRERAERLAAALV